MILAIDPGNIESAYVVLDDNLKPIEFNKVDNLILLNSLYFKLENIEHIAIEMIASYGMAVGQDVFDTCVWIGKFSEAIRNTTKAPIQYIYRKDVKMNLCQSMKAKDSNIIQALKDRFGDKGTKKNPGWFYGMKADCWQAYAVGVTYHDMYIKKVE